MSKLEYQKPVLETKSIFESDGQVDLNVFYIATKILDEEKYLGMYRKELKAVMEEREEQI